MQILIEILKLNKWKGAIMKYSDVIREIDNIFEYFKFHNKNLTKAQEWKLQELQDLIHELRK